MGITIKVTESLVCPVCDSPEVVDDSLPILEQRLNIRAHKVYNDGWWSQCLVCKEAGRPSWFKS